MATLHILDKVDYTQHRLVKLPPDPLPPLAPSSLRLQTKILGLTTNNFSYARIGHLMGWWDTYPQPENTPAPYNDRSAYGRISAWGYAEIIDSTVPDIPAGKTVYGYLPISNLPEDIHIEHTGFKDQIYVLNEHRQQLWKVYNRYQICAPLDELEKTKTLDSLGWDALMQGLFSTSYNINAYAFAWNEQNRIHPWGTGDWTAEDANLDDATVILLSASGKTSISLAHQLRRNRPREHQPRYVVGVGSEASKAMVEKGGLYDRTLLYSEVEAAKELAAGTRRVVLLDFGGRNTEVWVEALSGSSVPFTFITVGGEVKPQHPDDATKTLMEKVDKITVHASMLREKGIEVGGDAYFEGFYAQWEDFKKDGAIPGVSLKWAHGLEAWAEEWEALCNDKVGADTGLVFKI